MLIHNSAGSNSRCVELPRFQLSLAHCHRIETCRLSKIRKQLCTEFSIDVVFPLHGSRWNFATAFHVGEDRGEEIFTMLFASLLGRPH
jgi:hypothetical protein